MYFRSNGYTIVILTIIECVDNVYAFMTVMEEKRCNSTITDIMLYHIDNESSRSLGSHIIKCITVIYKSDNNKTDLCNCANRMFYKYIVHFILFLPSLLR